MYSQVKNVDIILSALLTFLTFFVILVTFVIFIYFSRKKILSQQLKNKDLQLQKQKEVTNAVINTQEQERSRIARDLHDDIGSKLNVLSMNIHLLELEDLDKTERQEIARDTLQACKLLIESTRQISHNLVPPILDKIGLHMALEEICGDFTSSGSTSINYSNPAEQLFFQGLTTENQTHLFRIIQELINNSIRHGKATEVQVVFTDLTDQKLMTYTDNGKGMTSNALETSKGIGLRNILSRADIIQSEAYFDTEHTQGFKFTLKF